MKSDKENRMTHEEWTKLTYDQKLTKIATICGWTSIQQFDVPLGRPPNSSDRFVRLPRYLDDFNVMHELESTLSDMQRRDFWYALVDLTKPDEFLEFFDVAHASCDQRAEAFVRAVTS